ncbi:MAG: Glutathione transport system permease protein GsiD [Syntrophomonadaceae bacterium]|nr:Glutathione transport system permease protein GsiD [Bacillota bacterium]
MWRRLIRNRTTVAGMIIVGAIVLMAMFAPFIAPHDPVTQNLAHTLRPPGREYLMGTDLLGRDLLSRIIHGSRISLLISLVAVTVAVVVGIFLGVISGYYEGKVDTIGTVFTNLLLAFPMVLLAILIVAILGPGIKNTIIAVAFPSVPIFARLMRGSVLSTKTSEYVESAKSLGASDLRIIVHHIMPNCMAPIIVQGSLRTATILLTVAGLSFLGLGVQPPTPEWGVLVSEGRVFLRTAPWVTIFPGLAIMFAILGLNLLGDGLRDVLDPRLKT